MTWLSSADAPWPEEARRSLLSLHQVLFLWRKVLDRSVQSDGGGGVLSASCQAGVLPLQALCRRTSQSEGVVWTEGGEAPGFGSRWKPASGALAVEALLPSGGGVGTLPEPCSPASP